MTDSMHERAIKAPNNPFSFWISGSQEVAFPQEPGAHPYFVGFQAKGWIPWSSIFWADDEAHVVEQLKNLKVFQRNCEEAYSRSGKTPHGGVDALHRHRDSIYNAMMEAVHSPDRISFMKRSDGEPEQMLLTIKLFDRSHPIRVSWGDRI